MATKHGSIASDKLGMIYLPDELKEQTVNWLRCISRIDVIQVVWIVFGLPFLRKSF